MLAELVMEREQSDVALIPGAGHLVFAACVLAQEQSGVSLVAGIGHMVSAAGSPLSEGSAEAFQNIVDSTHDVSSCSLGTW